jgi:peptidoglycan/xylan/chitin deacetylase (PgdA/CDA1 family)
MRQQADRVWPGGRKIAVVFNVCLEAWSDGKAPGISPMGNPLPAGVLDTMAISWAGYGVKRGIYRLLDTFARHRAAASVMVNAVIAERAPEAVKAVADAGHEVLSHSYAMDVIPALLSDADERANIARCTALLERASGGKVVGWLSPRGTSRAETPRLLAEAGYTWYGDVFDDDLPYVRTFGASKIVAIPLGTDVNDMPFMKYGNAPRTMLDSFTENVAIARETGEVTVIDVTCHAHIFGHPRGAYYYGKIIEAATADGDIWIGTRAQIARHVPAQEAP